MVQWMTAKIIFYKGATIIEEQLVFKTLHLHPVVRS
jgi:hypothetical protein